MQKKSILGKGLAVGILVLLGLNIVPAVESLSIVHSTEQVKIMSLSSPRGDNFTINGTMGENGWYRSGVWIIITYDPNVTAAVYYKLDNGNWTLYTGPFYVGKDGGHELYYYFVDYDGNVSDIFGPFAFKIDQTPPVIENFTVTPLNLFKTKWLFNLNVYDATSGIDKVEFYVDNVSVGNVTTPGPYTFMWAGGGKTVQAIVYDNAGNYASSSIITPCIQSQSSPFLRQKTMLFQHLIYNLILRYQLMVK